MQVRCTYGSVRGAWGDPRPYRDQTRAGWGGEPGGYRAFQWCVAIGLAGCRTRFAAAREW